MGRGDTTRMTFWLVITYDDMARDDAFSKSLREMAEELENIMLRRIAKALEICAKISLAR